jgi:inhibitor of KinA sporulation pathway (predicted exonuclease)
VLDFEANCIDGGQLECQEIIEFPVVPINAYNGSQVCEPFHYYIKPTVVPQITDFCTELTGINQDQVNNGITIDVALIKLNDWMDANGFTFENSTFVTCGMWDLKTCLRAES